MGKAEESLLSECLMPAWSSTSPVVQMCDAVGAARDEDAEPIGQDEEGLFIGKLGGLYFTLATAPRPESKNPSRSLTPDQRSVSSL